MDKTALEQARKRLKEVQQRIFEAEAGRTQKRRPQTPADTDLTGALDRLKAKAQEASQQVEE